MANAELLLPSQPAEAYKSLNLFYPIRRDYATCSLELGFNWTEAMHDLPLGKFYVVGFRSQRKELNHKQTAALYRMDDRSFEEAVGKPGLLLYFRGTLEAERNCTSACLWESEEQALVGSGGPEHMLARAKALKVWYEFYDVERWNVFHRPDDPPIFEEVQLR